MDAEADLEKAKKSNELTKAYELPDGQVVNINTPRFMAPEALFKPDLAHPGTETLGMHQLANQTVRVTDLDVQLDLYGNMIMSGGSTMYDGIADRLEMELNKLAPKAGSVKVIANADRYYSVW